MHPESVVSHVLGMAGDGASASEISRSTGLPRRTVSDWINGKVPATGAPAASQVASSGQARRSSRRDCSRLLLPARGVSRRRASDVARWEHATASHSGSRLSGDHRGDSGGDSSSRTARRGSNPPTIRRGLRRRELLLERVAESLPAARTRSEASARRLLDRLAARLDGSRPCGFRARPDPLRRLQVHRPAATRRRGLRVFEVLLQQPFFGPDPRVLCTPGLGWCAVDDPEARLCPGCEAGGR